MGASEEEDTVASQVIVIRYISKPFLQMPKVGFDSIFVIM